MTSEIRRFTRKELYDKVWRTPVDTLAKELGMSGRGLGKLCERHSIPVPPRGCWARKAAGQKVKQPPLVDLSDSKSPEVTIDLRLPTLPLNAAGAEIPPSLTREFYERQLVEIGILPVPPRLRKPHAIIGGWLKQDAIDQEGAKIGPIAAFPSTRSVPTPMGPALCPEPLASFNHHRTVT